MSNPFMELALEQAKLAAQEGEIPVGAVVVKDGAVIAAAHNSRERLKKATAHAEMGAIEAACVAAKSWHLSGCSLYVTLEPCMMCMGAALQARMEAVYFGAYSKTDNIFGVRFDAFEIARNYPITVYGGIMEEACQALLSRFFQQKRGLL
jgi:tRNA(adenine34) deaminase